MFWSLVAVSPGEYGIDAISVPPRAVASSEVSDMRATFEVVEDREGGIEGID